MRTTLVLQDDLLREARKKAAERNLTVSDIVNEALRMAFLRPSETTLPFTLVTYGGPARQNHEPSDFRNADDNEDRDRLR